MAAIGLGLKVADTVIDKHFHKIPEKYFHPHTYVPGKKAPPRCYGQRDTGSNSEEGSESETEVERETGSTSAGTERIRRGTRKTGRLESVEPQPEGPTGTESGNDMAEIEGVNDMQQPSRQGIPRNSGESRNNAYMSGAKNSQTQQYDIPPVYSHEPPKLRPQYMPSPPPIGQYYDNYGYAGGFPPPPSQPYPPNQNKYQGQSNKRLGRDRNYYKSDEDTNSDADDYRSDTWHSQYSSARKNRNRRPAAVTRRSSSYHGPRNRNDHNNSYGTTSQVQRYSGSNSRCDSDVGTTLSSSTRSIASRYRLKEEVSEALTTSKKGLAGSAIGAVVGGWAANKAQVAYGKENHHKNGTHETNPILTLLGAAVGGLAIDAAVALCEDQKSETAVKQERWDRKFDRNGSRDKGSGDGSESEGGGGRRGGGRGRGRKRRSERSGYGSD